MRRLVPSFILDNYAVGNLQGRFHSVALLLDASGFSKMADVLAQFGQNGAETLAWVMQSVFDPMVESVHNRGGFVIGFAGDSFTALFPADRDSRPALIQALTCSLEIQEKLSKHDLFRTEHGDFKISVRIGLGLGESRWRIVETENKRKAVYYFHGTAIERSVQSFNCAEAGEIIAGELIAEKLGKRIVSVKKGNHFLLKSIRSQKPEFHPAAGSPPTPEQIQPFWPDQIISQVHGGEFRPAVNLFIGIPPSAQSEAAFIPLLQKALTLQDQYGGLLTRPDYGDKGLNLLLFWGAPVIQENDVERALNFVLDLMKETGMPLRAGVSYFNSFSGFMGGSLREDYTCYGWGINLAARMMSSARAGEIWLHEEVARRIEYKFNLSFEGDKNFKGFAQPHKVWKLINRKEDIGEKVFPGEFFGREAELKQLLNFIAPLWTGQFAGALSLLGEAGIGKSRLIHQFRNSSIFQNADVLWAVGQTDEIIRQSLNPFRYWLKTYFGISYTDDENTNRNRFQAKIRELIASIPESALADDLERTQSFLGALVNVHWPDSLYEKLDAQGRYENTFIALSTLMQAESLSRPVILLIEDTHWADEDSLAFLEYLSRIALPGQNNSYPIAIIATSRSKKSNLKFREGCPNLEIGLKDLADNKLHEMVRAILHGEIEDELLNVVHQRAEGNPFFVEQVVRYLLEENLVRFEEDRWHLTGDPSQSLPTDVRSVLIARLDRLKQEVRDVVQTASVLGREFEVQILSRMLRGDPRLPAKIEQGAQANIWAAISEIRYIFRHALMRDAAYNMQLRSRQKELHRLALNALEELYRNELQPYYRQLAYHAEQAELIEKARSYYRLAGDLAAEAYQNNQAIENYSKAIELTPTNDLEIKFELLLARVPLFGYLGRQDQKKEDLLSLERIAETQNSDANRAKAALQRELFAFEAGDLEQSVIAGQRVIQLSRLADTPRIALHSYVTLPLALCRLGKIDTAIQEAETGIGLAQSLEEEKREGEILNTLGLIYLEQKEPRVSRSTFEKSLFFARKAGDKRLEARVLNNIGNAAGTVESDYSAARERYEQALAIARETGSRAGEGLVLANLGWVAGMQGDFDSAQTYQKQALRIAREVGSIYNEAYTLINLSGLAVAQSQRAAALAYANKSLELMRKMGDPSGEAWAWTCLGHAHFLLPDLIESAHSYEQALNLRRTLKQAALATEPLAGLAQTALEEKNSGLALKYAEEILSHLNQGGNLDGTEEPIRIYWSVYQALQANNDPRANRILDEAYELLQEQVNRFHSDDDRQMYVRNVPWRNGIMMAWMNK